MNLFMNDISWLWYVQDGTRVLLYIHSGDSAIYRYTTVVIVVYKSPSEPNGQWLDFRVSRKRLEPKSLHSERDLRETYFYHCMLRACKLTAKRYIIFTMHASYSPERYVLSLIGVIPTVSNLLSTQLDPYVSITLNVTSSFSDIIYTFIWIILDTRGRNSWLSRVVAFDRFIGSVLFFILRYIALSPRVDVRAIVCSMFL